MKKALPVFVSLAVFLPVLCLCFAQPADQPASEKDAQAGEKPLSESVRKGFEEAVQKLEAEKEKENKKVAADLQVKLDAAVQEWLSQQKKKRSAELNTIVEQQWENLTEFGPRIHRTYYLRNFSYTIINTDIIKSASVVDPYKAVINVTEKLFAERYHSPDVTYPQDYYYTVTTPVKVNFEYYKDRFVVTGVENGRGSIDPGWRK